MYIRACAFACLTWSCKCRVSPATSRTKSHMPSARPQACLKSKPLHNKGTVALEPRHVALAKLSKAISLERAPLMQFASRLQRRFLLLLLTTSQHFALFSHLLSARVNLGVATRQRGARLLAMPQKKGLVVSSHGHLLDLLSLTLRASSCRCRNKVIDR